MLRSILLFFTKSGTNLAESLVLSRTPAAFDTKGLIRSFRQSLPPRSLYKCRRNLSCSFSSIVIHIAVIIVGLLFILDIKVKKPQNPVRILLVAVVALALAKMFRLI